MRRVGLLYDSISNNTGDIAVGIAMQQVLDGRGIVAEIANPFSFDPKRYSTVIVGGGQLIHEAGDPFYDLFRIRGKYILNGVGLDGKPEANYLDEYAYVSTRSVAESALLQASVRQSISTIPCVTTLLKSKKYEIPGLENYKGKLVGIHLVPDMLRMCPDIIEIVNNIPHKKVFIPFTHYNEDASFMEYMPFDKSNAVVLDKLKPLELHSVISQMNYAIVSSLHASIFAYSQNVPFATMYQQKVESYFKDRGLKKHVFKSQAELRKLIPALDKGEIDFTECIAKDVDILEKTIDEYERIVALSRPVTNSSDVVTHLEDEIKKLELNNEQLVKVVNGRDILVHDLIYRYQQEAHSYRLDIKKLLNMIDGMKEEEAIRLAQEKAEKERVDNLFKNRARRKFRRILRLDRH
jgi:Polysaccharide pyruvyl transferase